MHLLIDGYNLMHAAGYLSARPTGNLDPVRRRFLDWLAGVAAAKTVAIRVVFDAQNGRQASLETAHRGVKVRFAHRKTADDEIESLLAPPDGLVVVSNDQRLHESARRAKAAAWACEQFIDWVVQDVPPPVPRPKAVPQARPT